MLRLLQMAFLEVYISHAFGARLHDHSQDAGFATAKLMYNYASCFSMFIELSATLA
jgi:hypothetical protein